VEADAEAIIRKMNREDEKFKLWRAVEARIILAAN
jgi:hypothetical protein